MLKNDFFMLSNLSTSGDTITAKFQLNGKNKIFNGHFPGNPVVPGACMMQMVKEITEAALGLKIQLTKADELKFLQIIDARKHNMLQMQLKYFLQENGIISISAILLNEKQVCFKFKGFFSSQGEV